MFQNNVEPMVIDMAVEENDNTEDEPVIVESTSLVSIFIYFYFMYFILFLFFYWACFNAPVSLLYGSIRTEVMILRLNGMWVWRCFRL